MKVVNVGCGDSVIDGAVNVDNTFAIFLKNHSVLYSILRVLSLLNEENIACVEFMKKHNVIKGDATKLPFENETIDVVYTSHMCEHLYFEDLVTFLHESYRVLKKNGILRIAIPDISILVDNYIKHGDADAFCGGLYMSEYHRMSLVGKIKYILFGNRGHKWMYDGASMKRFIEANSDFYVSVLAKGETTIIGNSGISLVEHADESVYLECRK